MSTSCTLAFATVLDSARDKEAVLVQEQAEAIHTLFGILIAALWQDMDLCRMMQQQLNLAARTDVYTIWPFPAVAKMQENHAAKAHCVADVLHAAYTVGRLGHLLPVLFQLMQSAPRVSPAVSFSLKRTLRLLAEAHDKPEVPHDPKCTISSSLDLWGFRPNHGKAGPRSKWSSTGPNSSEVLHLVISQDLEKRRFIWCNMSPKAALQTLDAINAWAIVVYQPSTPTAIVVYQPSSFTAIVAYQPGSNVVTQGAIRQEFGTSNV